MCILGRTICGRLGCARFRLKGWVSGDRHLGFEVWVAGYPRPVNPSPRGPAPGCLCSSSSWCPGYANGEETITPVTCCRPWQNTSTRLQTYALNPKPLTLNLNTKLSRLKPQRPLLSFYLVLSGMMRRERSPCTSLLQLRSVSWPSGAEIAALTWRPKP